MRHCYELLRRLDYASYMPTAHMSHGMRTPSIVLRALQLELLEARRKASTPALAAIRLQWWRDGITAAIDPFFDNHKRQPTNETTSTSSTGTSGQAAVRATPVLRALQQLSLHAPLSKYRLHRFHDGLTSRLVDAQPPGTLAALEADAEAMESTLLYVIAEGCGMSSTPLDHALSHLGKATGLAQGLATLLPELSRGRGWALPDDVLCSRGLTWDQLRNGTADMDALQDAVFEVARCARAHLDQALALQPEVGPKERLLLLHAVHPGMVLARLEELNFNALDASLARGLLGVNPLAFQWKLLWGGLRGRVKV